MVTTITTFETFDIDPEYPVREATRQRGIDSDGMSAVQKRITNQSHGVDSGEQSVRTWSMRWSMATGTDKTRLNTIWDTTLSGVLPMLFTPPGGAQVPVRFVGERLETSRVGPNQYSFSVKLEEVTNA